MTIEQNVVLWKAALKTIAIGVSFPPPPLPTTDHLHLCYQQGYEGRRRGVELRVSLLVKNIITESAILDFTSLFNTENSLKPNVSFTSCSIVDRPSPSHNQVPRKDQNLPIAILKQARKRKKSSSLKLTETFVLFFPQASINHVKPGGWVWIHLGLTST